LAVEITRCASVLLWLAVAAPFAAAQQDHKTWRNFGGGPDSSKYVASSQITKSNVNQLQVVWTYPAGDDNAYLFNPIVVDRVMYVLARNNSLVALDAVTGSEIWIHENLRGISTRGIAYWENKDRSDRRLIFMMNNFLEEIDALTGKSILSFGNNGLVDLREGLGRDPKTVLRAQSNTPGRVFENLILLGSAPGEGFLSAPGDLRAYDAITGNNVWTFHTIPRPGEFGYDTWPKDAWRYAGAANTWGEISIDEKRGIAYFPTGSATYDYYGADRVGANLFANCLLALDARTGKRLWHFQMVHHDLWDYDFTSAPQLITVRHAGKMVDAVAQAGKNSFLYVFDRVTGKPLWPIEERPVPKSDMPGEQAWPTQPFPTAPPPFGRQKMTVDDIDPYLLTPEERANWKDRIASARNGLYAPPTDQQESVALPGARGGSNWGTTAANPDKGMMFLSAQDWPSIYKLSLQQPAPSGRVFGLTGQAVYAQNCQACHGPDRGGTSVAPSLVGISGRYGFEDFRQVVAAGKGEMPAFANLDPTALSGLYAFLGDSGGRGRGGSAGVAPGLARSPRGPVVASGGAPGGLVAPTFSSYGPMGGPPYPEGIPVPENRYYTGYGLQFAKILSPPWSSLVAYDLNKGTIAWKVALGEDAQAAAEGAKNAGMLGGGERHGMVVTSTGLIFIATRDGKLRAFDQDNGNVLWTTTLPAASEGIPAMYEEDGREYLVVPASSPVLSGRSPSGLSAQPPSRAATAAPGPPKGYVVFALPQPPRDGH
jgi:quinoprotein glucose dehydrogenase